MKQCIIFVCISISSFVNAMDFAVGDEPSLNSKNKTLSPGRQELAEGLQKAYEGQYKTRGEIAIEGAQATEEGEAARQQRNTAYERA